MSLISKKFAKELSEKRGFRHKYQGAQNGTKIVRQIRAIRRQRGWSQAQFADRLGKPASNVSQRLENLDYSGFSLKTLLEVAEAFDVGLIVEFVPYEEFVRRTSDLSSASLEVDEFDEHELDELANAPEENVTPVSNASHVADELPHVPLLPDRMGHRSSTTQVLTAGPSVSLSFTTTPLYRMPQANYLRTLSYLNLNIVSNWNGLRSNPDTRREDLR